MINKIQLRGISRTPSDRMTADGGCAESLNVHLDEQELAPTLPPKDASDMLDDDGNRMFPSEGYPDAGKYDCVYIHKTADYKKAILKLYNTICVWNGVGLDTLITLDDSETFKRCLHLGNSLGVVTDKRTNWFIFKRGVYTKIGNDIPFPRFEVVNKEVDEEQGVVTRSEIITTWEKNNISEHTIDTEGKDVEPSTGLNANYIEQIWAKIDQMVAQNNNAGVYSYAHSAILALKLYDGSRIVSTPILIPAGFEQPFEVKYDFTETPITANDVTTFNQKETIQITLHTAHKIRMYFSDELDVFAGWEDIIDCIEVYLSPLLFSNLNRNGVRPLDDYSFRERRQHTTPLHYWEGRKASGTVILGDEDYSYEQEFVRNSQYYLAASFGVKQDELKKLQSGVVIDTKNAKRDDTTVDIMLDENLIASGYDLDSSSDMKHYGLSYSRGVLYNQSIIANDIINRIRFQLDNPYSCYRKWECEGELVPEDFQNARRFYTLTFHLKDNAGHDYTIKAFSRHFRGAYESWKKYYDTGIVTSPYSPIICPDSRAYAVDIKQYTLYGNDSIIPTSGTIRATLKQHPYLDCAYWYGLGPGVSLDTYVNHTNWSEDKMARAGIESVSVEGDEGVYEQNEAVRNKIYVSNMDNPLVFPIDSRFTFTDRVLGCAIASKALSTGQYGQFPLYVFTDGGIWTMETNSEGRFRSPKPGPREVCTNPDSITSIDNAVVFVTSRAVMLISGGDVINLSPDMNGKHFALDSQSEEYGLISRSANWGELAPILTDNAPFMAFIQDAQIAYDYEGKRLIFFNGTKSYQYVYMLLTQTWHKIPQVGPSFSRYRTVNDYPRCLISGVTTQTYLKVTVESVPAEHKDSVVYMLTEGGFMSQDEAARAVNNCPFWFYAEMSQASIVSHLRSYLCVVGSTLKTRAVGSLLDYSTVLNSAALLSDTSNPVKGIIITRPFDLGEPDVRKTIKDIRIRGQFNRNDVRYILLGSFDDIHWQRLTSLRGGSYKLFRMIILTNLSPTERISWVDVDYESRFTNKLR